MKPLVQTPSRPITIGLFIAVILNIVVLRIFDAPLKNEVAPGGIISFELAGNLDKSVEILDSWEGSAKVSMGLSLGFDFLFLCLYSSLIAVLILNVNRRLWAGQAFEKVGKVLIVLIFGAAVFDMIENIALIRLGLGDLQEIWSSMAMWFATIKFLIVLVCIIYLLVNWVTLLVKRPVSEANQG